MKIIQLGGHRVGSLISGYTLVDDADYEHLNKFKWLSETAGYIRRYDYTKTKRAVVLMHREIMNPPKEMHIDHANGKVYDNRRSNLRICTRSQNQMNKKISGANTSGHRGVRWKKQSQKWVAEIKVQGIPKFLGSFKNREAAILIYRQAAKNYFGEFCPNYLKN